MTLRLSSWDDVLAQLDVLARAPSASIAGPWPLPMALSHCAQSIELSLVGYPVLRSGLFRATVGRIVKRRFLARGEMSHDRAAPIPGAPPLPAGGSIHSAIGRVRTAIGAFMSHRGPFAPHLAYGECTRAEYERLHAMHLADHLSLMRG